MMISGAWLLPGPGMESWGPGRQWGCYREWGVQKGEKEGGGD